MSRNNDIAAILEASIMPPESSPKARTDMFVGGGDGSMILDHEICILNGDLNYRIDISRDSAIHKVKNNDLAALLERDQLLMERRKNPGFRLRVFNEANITFAPTYKYDVGTDVYDTSEKKRVPAWCDRVLYRGRRKIEQTQYRRWEVKASDHRPVTAAFNVSVKTVDPARRKVIWQRCCERYEAVRQKYVWDAK
jgi:endonuclease/exonuclease/phosphatase family metal-dependent hydrolase